MRRLPLRRIALIALILAGSATAAELSLTFAIPSSPCAGVSGTQRIFTFVADVNGYNGSKTNGGAGPYVAASRCDTITMKLVNNDLQTHGLAVAFYAPRGIEANNQEKASFTFVATKSGTFQIYCITQSCTVHFFMQHAALTVA